MKPYRVIYTVLLSGLLLSFMCNCKKEQIKTAPTVSISAITNITSNSATSGGIVSADGGAALTACGVCWSTSQNPTVSDSKTSDGASSGSFTSLITGLTQGMTYYLKAYATNSVGTGYSSQITFTHFGFGPCFSHHRFISAHFHIGHGGWEYHRRWRFSGYQRAAFAGVLPRTPQPLTAKQPMGQDQALLSVPLQDCCLEQPIM